MRYLVAFVVLFFSSCVSLKQYKEKEAKHQELADANKSVRKEIATLKKEEKALSDTIKYRTSLNGKEAAALTQRLKDVQVNIQVKGPDLGGLNVEEPDPDPEWSKEMWNTNKNRDTSCANKVTWLTADEKKIYYYLNKARLDPKGFCNQYILPELKEDSGNIYLLTLADYMLNMHPRNAVKPEKTLFESAKCHAISSGKEGYTGHTRLKGCTANFAGECCSYGVSNPLGVVLQLLIDEGVSSLGHRYICLGWYEECGISIQPHTGYRTNVVLDFN
jgi:hypothetical protein